MVDLLPNWKDLLEKTYLVHLNKNLIIHESSPTKNNSLTGKLWSATCIRDDPDAIKVCFYCFVFLHDLF